MAARLGLDDHAIRDDVRTMSISWNGILATTTADGTEGTETFVWDVSDANVRPHLLRRIPNLGSSVSISADGKRLASGSFRRHAMKLCNVGTKVEVFDIDLQSKIT